MQIHGKFLIRLWEKEELIGPLCLQIKGIEGRFSDWQVLKCLHSILDSKKKVEAAPWNNPLYAPRGVLLGILGGGVPPSSSNPVPIYVDFKPKMWFSTPVFRLDI